MAVYSVAVVVAQHWSWSQRCLTRSYFTACALRYELGGSTEIATKFRGRCLRRASGKNRDLGATAQRLLWPSNMYRSRQYDKETQKIKDSWCDGYLQHSICKLYSICHKTIFPQQNYQYWFFTVGSWCRYFCQEPVVPKTNLPLIKIVQYLNVCLQKGGTALIPHIW